MNIMQMFRQRCRARLIGSRLMEGDITCIPKKLTRWIGREISEKGRDDILHNSAVL